MSIKFVFDATRQQLFFSASSTFSSSVNNYDLLKRKCYISINSCYALRSEPEKYANVTYQYEIFNIFPEKEYTLSSPLSVWILNLKFAKCYTDGCYIYLFISAVSVVSANHRSATGHINCGQWRKQGKNPSKQKVLIYSYYYYYYY